MISLNEQKNDNSVMSKEERKKDIVSFFNLMIGGNDKNSKKIKIIFDDLVIVCHKIIKDTIKIDLPIVDINKTTHIDTLKLRITWLILVYTFIEPESVYYLFETRSVGTFEGEILHETARSKGFIPRAIINDLYKDVLDELKKSKSNDELFIWLYDLMNIILEKYSLKLDETYMKTFYNIPYELTNCGKKCEITQSQMTICIFLSNLLANCLLNLNVQDSKLKKKNDQECNEAKKLFASKIVIIIILIFSFIAYLFLFFGCFACCNQDNKFIVLICGAIGFIIISLIIIFFAIKPLILFGGHFKHELITV